MDACVLEEGGRGGGGGRYLYIYTVLNVPHIIQKDVLVEYSHTRILPPPPPQPTHTGKGGYRQLGNGLIYLLISESDMTH